jgi:3-methyladenine DNA glycosylase/8-oxoguanine DNA glycosylase
MPVGSMRQGEHSASTADAKTEAGADTRPSTAADLPANGVGNKVSHLVYSYHHANHATAIGQQLSVSATRTILARLQERFEGHVPSSPELLAADPQERRDVLLSGDLALRRAVGRAYGFDHLPTEDEMVQVAERWRPYRSLATCYLFASEFEKGT